MNALRTAGLRRGCAGLNSSKRAIGRCAARSAAAPGPTPESKQPTLASVYALSKFDQERLSLLIGRAYNIPTVALRFFNVYGTRQALSNPYTGVAAIFSGSILGGRAPAIFEDGHQQRDFVHVSDVVAACRLAMQSPAADNQALNVGSGRPVSVLEVAETLAQTLAWQGGLDIRRQFRAGDIRHCFANIDRIQSLLGYQPRYAFRDGVQELVAWEETSFLKDRVTMYKYSLKSGTAPSTWTPRARASPTR